MQIQQYNKATIPMIVGLFLQLVFQGIKIYLPEYEVPADFQGTITAFVMGVVAYFVPNKTNGGS